MKFLSLRWVGKSHSVYPLYSDYNWTCKICRETRAGIALQFPSPISVVSYMLVIPVQGEPLAPMKTQAWTHLNLLYITLVIKRQFLGWGCCLLSRQAFAQYEEPWFQSSAWHKTWGGHAHLWSQNSEYKDFLVILRHVKANLGYRKSWFTPPPQKKRKIALNVLEEKVLRQTGYSSFS